MKLRPLPSGVAFGVMAFQLAALLLLEYRHPLREATENKAHRDLRNLVVAAVAALPVALIETPLAQQLTVLAERKRLGLLKALRLPFALETLCAVLLLDYTMYAWHVLAHRAQFLWRFHLVHHSDRDMDVTTAVRFHALELTLSIPYRALQILVIGVSPLAYSIWQVLFTSSVLFHHSNLRLPQNWERWLERAIVTPRMHGIHHASNERLQNANWSSGLIVWDKLHGTFISDAPRAAPALGLPAYRTDADATLAAILTSPFQRQKDPWLV